MSAEPKVVCVLERRYHLVDAFAIYAVTLCGGRHVVLPRFEAAEALRAVERERVSCCNMASTMVLMLLNNPAAELVDLSSLRILSCGGSPLPPAAVERAIALFGCEFFVRRGRPPFGLGHTRACCASAR